MQTKEERESAVRETKVSMILDAALDSFNRLGYHATKLEDIASAAGFCKTALYYYFHDKEEIFLNLFIRETEQINSQINGIIDMDLPFSTSIKEITRLFLTKLGKHYSFVLALSSYDISQLPDPKISSKHVKVLKNLREHRNLLDLAFLRLVKRAKAHGELGQEFDDVLTSGHLASLIRGVFFRWWLNNKANDIGLEVDSLVKFAFNGLGISCHS